MDGKQKVKLGYWVEVDTVDANESTPEPCSSRDMEAQSPNQLRYATDIRREDLRGKEMSLRIRALDDERFSRPLDGMETMLPEEILQQVFGYMEHEGRSYLRRCRMVCKSWKTAIDNCPALMRKLVFHTSHLESLSTSSVAGKIRAIRVDNILSDDDGMEKLKMFLSMSGKNIESVKLDVDTSLLRNSQDEKRQTALLKIFDILESSCPRLEELNIVMDNLILVGPDSATNRDPLACQDMFKRVKKLTISTHSLTFEFGIEDVVRVLGMFPSLTSLLLLGITNYGDYDRKVKNRNDKILCGLIAHMKTRPTALKLLDIREVGCGEDDRNVKQLVLTTIELSMRVKILGTLIFEPKLMEYFLEEGITLTPNNSWCITSGFISFDDYEILPEAFAKFGECSYIEEFYIQISRPMSSEELAFLSQLPKLRKLELEKFDEDDLNIDIFPTCQAVEILEISGSSEEVLFGTLHKCLPNLHEIHISYMKISEDFCGSLAKLKRLTRIRIHNKLADEHVLAKQLYYPFQSDRLRNCEDPILHCQKT